MPRGYGGESRSRMRQAAASSSLVSSTTDLQFLCYPRQSVNLAVKAFLDSGIVELKELPENRRNKGITLTEKGRKLCEEVIEPMIHAEDEAFLEMGDESSRELVRLMQMYGESYCRKMKSIS